MGLVSSAALTAVQVWLFVYDVITYPIYQMIQKPWRRREIVKKQRGILIERTSNSVTYKPMTKTNPQYEEIMNNNITTMDKLFKFAAQKHGHKKCLGTRQLLAEEDEVQSNNKVYKKWDMGEYRWNSYTDLDGISTHVGRGLRHLGLNPKEKLAILCDTRAEWMLTAIGCFKQNFPLVTLYTNLGNEAVAFGLNQTKATHVVTSHELLPKFGEILSLVPSLRCVVYVENPVATTDVVGLKEGVQLVGFRQVVQMGKHSEVPEVPPSPEDPAIIMYTSGSTGIPKGVILTHNNLTTTVKAFTFVVQPIQEDDIYLSYLPLAHVLELTAGSTMLYMGIPLAYSSPNTLTDKSTKIKTGGKGDCSVIKPTLMCAVPLILDRIYKGISENVGKKGPFFKALFDFCYRYKLEWSKSHMTTPIMDLIIFRNVKSLVGGNIRLILSGGAPLSPDTHDYVKTCLGPLPLIQGYGLTESCACASVMESDDLSTGGVGTILQNVIVKLVNWEEGGYRVTDTPRPRGEIYIGGGNVAKGYYDLPGKTAEDFFEEKGIRYFRTGDIGEMETDGTLKIIDRKKDLVKLQFGEYVSLGKIESEMKTCPLVENICIYCDSSKYYGVALVVPDRAKLEALALRCGRGHLSFEEMCEDEEVKKAFMDELDAHGLKSGLQKFELPGALTLCSELWTPESGLVTAAFKLKRKPLQDFYQKDLDRMYGARSA